MIKRILNRILNNIDLSKDEQVRFLGEIIKIPAVAPSSGGCGEWDKVELIVEWARTHGFSDIERFDVEDLGVPSGSRPNVVVWLKGKRNAERIHEDMPRLLVITHTDVVPPGDLKAWDSDPYSAVVSDGRIFGRGAEDNGQSLTAALFAARAVLDNEILPVRDVGLVMVAYEEIGNEKGILHLMNEGFFKKNDLILVPDHGEPDGRLVEVSEKSLAWIKVTTKGKQCHSSRPDRGNNAHRAAMKFGTMVDEALHNRFDHRDGLFDFPLSSFEPTKKVANIQNVNTIPGEDILYFDCRVLPRYRLNDIITEMRRIADTVEKVTGTSISLDPVLRDEATEPTPADAPIVKMLLSAIDSVYNSNPYPGGIGGSTAAAILRRAGYNAAVWETVDNTAHSPNEYAVIDNMVNDCKVFATLFTDGV
ncbi:MAG: M20 family metallo-hydrolase [Thermoplasmata archaeon]|nr:MAG: M20 family metallo-hydrolase [Thermoplasmata archaeon]